MNKHTYTHIHPHMDKYIYKLKQIQKTYLIINRGSLFNFACYTSHTVCLKTKKAHFTYNLNYEFHLLPPKWLVLVQQMLDVIIFSETCGATVEPAVHQKRTHYRAFQIVLAHFPSTSTAYP